MKFNIKRPANILMLSGLFLLFVILLKLRLDFMFSPSVNKSGVNKEKTEISKSMEFSATPTEAVRRYADKDIAYTSASLYPPLFSVTIPKGATYYQEGEPLFIEGERGLKIMICTTCQLFIQGCNGLSDGDPKEGGCAIKDVPLQKGYLLESHYQLSEPDKILGYRVISTDYKARAESLNYIRITTTDYRNLTLKDKDFIYKIASSIK